MSKLQTLKVSLVSVDLWAEVLINLIFLIGLLLLGYGLWLFKPWLAFAVVGAVMVLVALGAAILRGVGSRAVSNAE